ncbi:RNA polymerase sigma factor [Algihabitans albus]|uniref:RNA polymerase sigma factor n=1 Tax=Algihabitans albus TaxID=2164067 RepID=UPI0013C2F8CB|nr:RNA polymerase sigma factor [Algihabitans albus]
MRNSDVQDLYLQYGQELQGYLTRRLSCVETAADLTQEAFVRLIGADPSRAVESPRAYLYRIASNLVTDHYRDQKKRPQPVTADRSDAVADRRPGQERTLLAKDQVGHLERAIEGLPRRQREVLLLHKFEGMSYGEIALRLGISKNTVMVHMMRALAHCRDSLSDIA